MKITYAVIPIDDPVQSSIDSGGTSAAQRAVKITLKNLKRWCERLRHRMVARDFKNNRDKQLEGIPYDGNITMTMIIDQEESRNRANENLENELRESLKSTNDQSNLHFRRQLSTRINDLAEDHEPPVRDLSRMEVIARVLRGLEGSFRSP